MSEHRPIEDELQVEDNDNDDEQFIEYDLAVYPSDLTLRVIADMWNSSSITIPPFQRRFVWTIRQSSRLIESFLLGLPVPQVFFYIDDKHRNLVIDGQQRIMSVLYYLNGFFGEENPRGERRVFRLQGLSEESPFSNKTFSDLGDVARRQLERSVLRAVNIRQLAPRQDQSSMYHIFERLNTGGTPLRPQEIRNCVYSGQLVTELNRLNGIEPWRALLGRKEPDKHQRDVEMILRIFALWDRWEEYSKPMKGFLNQQMASHRMAGTEQFDRFRQAFEQGTELIADRLGGKPFHVRGPINLAAMDSTMAVILRRVANIPSDFAGRMAKLLKDKEYRESIYFNTSDVHAVRDRMQRAERALFEA